MIRGLDNSTPGEVDADASILQVSESKNLLCKAATYYDYNVSSFFYLSL